MRVLIFLTGILLATACNEAAKEKTAVDKSDDGSESSFFPVTDFIRGQVHLVDSFQSITFRYITRNDKTDSSLISVAEFKEMAREFLHPDLAERFLKENYEESNFADQSSQTVVFNYTARNPKLEIRRVDVVVDAHPAMYDKVRSIYQEKQSTRSDTLITEKLYWRTDKNFQIIRTMEIKGRPESVVVTKVVWDN
jgi:hypothetical protein